ncbi:unnamed protein product [Zymoseptoria tritici ST99CH_1E4]|uniref:Uncharacterized protein n=1 Tax=Zymoseptoria tritici ST99CH_1E4 TaxID=1276532 RepID=A0A2H1GTC3_ZYMTR|nr:unnamed protein product [Zymoseptoria tritici ST99CH_1E4]
MKGRPRDMQKAYWTAILDAHRDRLPDFNASVAIFAAFSTQIMETAQIAELNLDSMRRIRKNVFHFGFYWEGCYPTKGSVALTAMAMDQSVLGLEHGMKVAKLEREQKLALYELRLKADAAPERKACKKWRWVR